ncbi:MAG: heme biosynthesis protein HemY [Gammaproteobacteria bacterium]|nr:heme biosynthesis protein HemY [Gammaproteobacteria bacterium]MBU1656016.1 heme biosynthesis protein HemY [Gammaproteobacteria bacterium]MBU1962224.1 heme biosynthesis protein HemY [Gammaproteobacteria bacterium]
MKWLFGTLAVMLASVALTLLVNKDNGYVLIGYGTWTLEGSLAFFVLVNMLLFLLFYLAVRSIKGLWTMPQNVRAWNGHRLSRRARSHLTRGLVQLAEGRWQEAEKSLLRHAENSDAPLLNYLAAARAAQAQSAHERRDNYLHQAHESMPSADVAVGLTQAELQLSHHQMEQALATLMHLRSISPKHRYVLMLLKSLYESLNDWSQLAELLPELRKYRIFSSSELYDLELNVQVHLLRQAANDPNGNRLPILWDSLARPLRSNPMLVREYASLQIKRDSGADVEGLIRDTLNHQWNADLIALYGFLEGEEPTRMLANGEKWLAQRPKDSQLLLALGRLAMRGRLWGKARSYFEASIGEAESPEAYRELGTLLDQLEEADKATECFRKGLELSTRGKSPQPLPAPEVLGSRSLIKLTTASPAFTPAYHKSD